MDEIKIKAEQLANDMAAAKAEAASAKAEAAALKAEVEQKGADLEAAKTSIDNLDASVKEQAKTIEMLRVELSERPTTFRKEFRRAFDAVKDDIVKLVAEKKDKFEITLELKSVSPVTASGITGSDYVSVQADPTVHGAPHSNVFIMAFGLRPRTALKLGWIEATATNNADYVSELAQNTNESTIAFAEKTRAYGKIATLSSTQRSQAAQAPTLPTRTRSTASRAQLPPSPLSQQAQCPAPTSQTSSSTAPTRSQRTASPRTSPSSPGPTTANSATSRIPPATTSSTR